MPGRNVMLESTSGTCAFEVPRNWKQAPTIFWLEFGTGNRHVPFFRSCPAWSSVWSSAWSSPQSWGDNRIEGGNPGVTTGLKEAILEFFPGNPLVQAPMPGRRGRASMPGSWGLAAVGKKKRAAVLPPREDWNFFLGRIPTLARAPMPGRRGRASMPGAAPSRTLTVPRALAICAICAISHKATSTLPGFLAICAICAISHKASH